MKSAVAIRHVLFEDLGAFGPLLAGAGFDVRYSDVGDADFAVAETAAADLLIMLGGPIGATEEAAYPFLRDELRILERRLAARRPTMGICLGAQLIARAAGARVYPNIVKEIGFGSIALTEAGTRSCLKPFVRDPVTLHWHGDTFDLPTGAERLASTAACENQAFSLGPNVIGFQFHPEADGRGIEKWLVGHAVELAAAGIDIARVRADAARHGDALRRKAHDVLAIWLAQLEE